MGSPYKTVAFETLGCKLNFSETSTLARDFISKGYAQVDNNDIADLYVINTCSVTDNADKKAKKAVRRIHRKSPLAKIAVIGCYAQLNPAKIAQIPGVSIVVGAEDKMNLAGQIEAHQLNALPIILNSDVNTISDFKPSYSYGERTRSFLKVQDGCDYNCSFCTIPLARGKSRSCNISMTLAQAHEISQTKVREIVLTGVNIGDFGKCHNESFIQLIKKLDEVEGIDRYRISSIEPNLLTDEIIEFIAISKKFLPHFHIPLQSGSDEILKNMRRRYKTELYFNRVKKIQSIVSPACIGVDVIVGFPGENDHHFNETYDFLNALDISYLHVFSFSMRNNTEALNINDRISPDIILERSKMLQHLSIMKKRQFYEKNIGSVRQVLIENYEDGLIWGHSENYIPVRISGGPSDINKIIPVKLIQFQGGKMIGERQA